MTQSKQMLLVWSFVMLSVFGVIPFIFMILGLGFIKGVGLAIIIAASLIDTFSSYIGFKNGFNELNPIFQLFGKKMNKTKYLVITEIFTISMGLVAVIFYSLEIILVFILLFLIGGLGNNMVLAFHHIKIPYSSYQHHPKQKNKS